MQIRNHVFEGEEVSCILLGDESIQLPRHMMQGEKQKGILAIDGEEKEWTWKGLCTIEGMRYFYFDRMEIEPFERIADKYRDRALEIVTNLAAILARQKEDFIDPLVGTIATYRFFIVEGRGLLILPPDLADLIALYMSEEERYTGQGCWVCGGTEEGFAAIRQAGEILYWALTGIRPFEDRAVRDAGYLEIPLDAYRQALFPTLDDKTLGFINFTLHAKEREQRDIMGNRKSHENLAWFVAKAQTLSWKVPPVEEGALQAKAEEISSSGAVAKRMEEIAQKAKRRNFWRKKGGIITVAAIVVLLVGSLVGNYLYNALQPPFTRDMEQEEIIRAIYQAQNNLDVDGLTDPLKGCDAPQESEVINLFVTSRTRSAYESTDPHIPVDQWIAAGRPAVPLSSFIYGISDLEITQTGENSWHVEGIYNSPYAYNEEDRIPDEEVPTDKVMLYTYAMQQDFGFTWNNRGWWNVSEMSDITVQFLGIEYVEGYVQQNQALI